MDSAPSRPTLDYLPIAEHGVIGDQRSVALVGTDGTIDWYCPERFDGPSVFAAILDRHRGGCYRIAPTSAEAHSKQMYLPETNVLITSLHESRDDGVKRALAGRERIGMRRIEREERAAILQHKAHTSNRNAGTE